MLRLDDIRIYPVKGMRGHSVREATVEPWGLRGDRRWMVVEASGRFLSQREIPALAVIRAGLRPGGLTLSAADRPSIDVPEPEDARPVDVEVWRDRVAARPAGAEADAWLSSVLGVACRLVFMADPAAARAVDPEFGEAGDHVSFADGFPLLATSSASLADLNRRLATPVTMDRFRTNLTVGGGEAWNEDAWSALTVGAVPFAAVKDCARCVVTTVDQDTGTKAPDAEPLRTLARFRRKPGGRIIFGQNLVPRGTGRIAVGDAVEVS